MIKERFKMDAEELREQQAFADSLEGRRSFMRGGPRDDDDDDGDEDEEVSAKPRHQNRKASMADSFRDPEMIRRTYARFNAGLEDRKG